MDGQQTGHWRDSERERHRQREQKNIFFLTNKKQETLTKGEGSLRSTLLLKRGCFVIFFRHFQY